ncbi:MAG TPA: DUF2127 domain-containing protein [Opitutaceae bacterium]|jgi:uncharacterized membrane protein (DUF2068 family)
MADAASRPRHPGLRILAAVKLFKALLLLFVAFGSFHYIKHDYAERAQMWAHRLSVDPENRVLRWLASLAPVHRLLGDLVENLQQPDPSKLRDLGGWSLFFAVDQIAEGLGLWYNQGWAKWLLLATTPIFFAYECARLGFELSSGHVSTFHALAVPTTALILVYLIWIFRADFKRSHPARRP